MTVKTLTQTSEINIETRKSDMIKRGAVRNLFNTTVDRDELQKQTAQLENESLHSLQSYKVDSVIGVIQSANQDQAGKFKRTVRCLESDDDSDEDEEPQRVVRTQPDEASDTSVSEASSSSSTTNQDQPTQSSTSEKSSDLRLIASSQLSLPRAKKTITGEKNELKFLMEIFANVPHCSQFLDYFSIVKRKRDR